MIVIHSIIAILSIIVAGYAYFRPSAKKINITYLLIGATFLSGIWMILVSPVSLAHACVAGIGYLVVVGAVAVAARNKLAHLSA